MVAVELIVGAGGVPIIAHPAGRAGAAADASLMERMFEAGLAGFELGHRENLDAGMRTLRRICAASAI